MKKVSVIIPLYNQFIFLQEAINSVKNSTYKNIEIIIVNDGSTDITQEELCALFSKDIQVLNIKNSGVCIARNIGIKKASGEYILTLDADDKIEATFISKAVNILEENQTIGIVYAKASYFGTKSGEWFFPKYNKFEMLIKNNIIPSFAMFKKSLWEEVGGYKTEMESGGEDWEFWISLIEKGAQPFRIEEFLLYYRRHPDSKTACNYENLHWERFKKILYLHPKLYSDNIIDLAFPLFFKLFKESNYIKQLKYIGILLTRAFIRPVTIFINKRNIKKLRLKNFCFKIKKGV